MPTITETLQYAWASRRVWWFTATARTHARFVRTKLGSFWLGLSNLLSIGVLAFVYGAVFKVTDFSAYAVYLGIGLVTWNSLSLAIGSAPTLFEYNSAQLRNTNLNPIFYPLEEWAFQVQTFIQSFLLVLLALSFLQASLLPHLLLHAWLPLLNIFLFMFWVPLVICLVGARYRDLYQLVPIALQLVFLLSPILYRKTSLGGLVWLANLNPIFLILDQLRASLVYGSVDLAAALLCLIANVAGLFWAVYLLNRERPHLPFIV